MAFFARRFTETVFLLIFSAVAGLALLYGILMALAHTITTLVGTL